MDFAGMASMGGGFGGGGFDAGGMGGMGSGSGATPPSGAGGPGGRGSLQQKTLVSVTMKQLATAIKTKTGDDSIQIDGKDVNRVSAREKLARASASEYSHTDGTEPIVCPHYCRFE